MNKTVFHKCQEFENKGRWIYGRDWYGMDFVCNIFISALHQGKPNYVQRFSSDIPTPQSRSSASSGLLFSRDEQKGFTLVETMVTIVLLVAMLSLSIGAYRYFWAGRSLDAAVREITTEIRHAQTMAVASGNAYRINFDVANNNYVLQSRQGSEWINDGDAMQLPGSVKFDSESPPSFEGDGSAEFYARGVSENGQLVVKSFYGRTKMIQLQGETANITVTG